MVLKFLPVSKAVLKDGQVFDLTQGANTNYSTNPKVTQVGASNAWAWYRYGPSLLFRGSLPPALSLFTEGIVFNANQSLRNLIANVKVSTIGAATARQFLPPSLNQTYVYITNLFNRGGSVLFPSRVQERSIYASNTVIAAPVHTTRSKILYGIQGNASIALEGVRRYIGNFTLVGEQISNSFKGGLEYYYPTTQTGLNRNISASQTATIKTAKLKTFFISSVQNAASIALSGIQKNWNFGRFLSGSFKGGTAYYYIPYIFTLPRFISVVSTNAARVQKSRTAFIRALQTNTPFAIEGVFRPIYQGLGRQISNAYKGGLAYLPVPQPPIALTRNAFASSIGGAQIKKSITKTIFVVQTNTSKILYTINRLVKNTSQQISQALFGGEQLFPTQRVFNRLAIVTQYNSASIDYKKYHIAFAIAAQIWVAAPNYLRIKKIQALLVNLSSARKGSFARARQAYGSQTSIVSFTSLKIKIRFAYALQTNNAQFLRTSRRLKFINITLINAALPLYTRSKRAFGSQTNSNQFYKRVSKLNTAVQVNVFKPRNRYNPVKNISVAINNAAYFAKLHNPSRFVKFTQINIAPPRAITRGKATVAAVNTSTIKTLRIMRRIRFAIAVEVFYFGDFRNFQKDTGKAVMIRPITLNKRSQFYRKLFGPQVGIGLVRYIRNRNIRVTQIRQARFATNKIRRVYQSIEFNGAGVRYVRGRNIRADQVRATINRNTKQRVRYIKAVLNQESKFLRTRAYRRPARANQVVAVKITKASSKNVRASMTYEISVNRRVNYVRRARATMVATITSKKYLGKIVGVPVKAIVYTKQQITTTLRIPVIANVFRKQNITTKINVPVITRVENQNLNVSDQWTIPNNGEPVPGSGPNVFDDVPIDYDESNDQVGEAIIPDPNYTA